MSESRRIHVIDYLRGFAIFIVILTHVLSEYRSQSHLFYLFWDSLHFAVPIFVFCSAYIFFERYKSLQMIPVKPFVLSRLKRLLIPYYIFLFLFFAASSFFSKMLPTGKQIAESMALIGGVDINWLVLLFVQLMFIMLGVLYLQKHKPILYFFTSLSIVSTVVFLFYRPGFSARHLHWISWSSVVLYTYFFVKSTKRSDFNKLSLICSVSIFVPLFILQLVLQFSSSLFLNKYPPNSYYLSYGMGMLSFWYLLFTKVLQEKSFVAHLLSFFSQYSYQLFFIHYLLLFIVSHVITITSVPWYILFAFIMVLSSVLANALHLPQSALQKTSAKI